ncbi:MAG: hypothetical protein IKD69_15670, partial [Solobacterium sp.]|nr:hypothetical protein [Solobacterium sp.]
MNQNETIEICVIDDNPQDLKWIIECVRQSLPDARTDAFSELSGFIRQGKKYDLFLLDIVLGETLSIHHAGYLQKYASYILYVTGIDELMRASFGPKVVGYFIKQDGKQALIEKLREI